jgi:hypothetical protein
MTRTEEHRMTTFRHILIAGLTLGVVLLAQPTLLHAQTSGEEEQLTRANTPMIVSGLFTFGLAYSVSALVAATTDDEANDELYMPIVGPWRAIQERGDCPVAEADCAHETTVKIRLGVLGVFQAIGAATFLYGLVHERKVNRATVAGQEMDFVPVSMAGGGRGLAVTGSF